MNKNVLIIGLGEVGNSVLELYSPLQTLSGAYTLYYKDLNKKTDKAINIKTLKDYINIDVLHICIPFIKDFKVVILKYIKDYKPSITLIHSTVNIGTTRSIANDVDSIVAHTPIMGVHPNLTKSIQTFKKIVGVIKEEDKESILEHFNSIKVIPEFYDKPEDSEAAKLFSTTYYGHNIRFMQETHRFCEVNNLDFEKVYTRTNEIYNEGYTKMDMKHVRRPILNYMGDGISGHCVLENAKILVDNDYIFPIAEEIIKLGKPKKNDI